ncbi:MAG: succinate dehydrogenase, cytochrome b556 subunit [Rhizobiales bacterium]|nr:succinate dehydrogenase, cytochrome b556 subunit [Hyphomicrobiales bacterium]
MAEASTPADKRPRVSAAERPLSPHLQIYRPMLTMMMSITHRITGAALYLGSLLLVWWLLALATDARAFQFATDILTSWFGRLVLFGFTLALFTHFMGGLRHFVWDTGRGMEHPQREWLAQATLVGGVGLTLLVWIAAYALR